MGRFETYSKRKFKVSMVLFARMSWPWKATLTKTLQKPNSLPESIFSLTSKVRIHPCIDFHFLLSSCSEHSSGGCVGSRAGQGAELWLSRSGCTGWSWDTSPCAGQPCWGRQVSAGYLHRGLVQLLLAWEAVGRRQLLRASVRLSSSQGPAHTRGSSDSGSKSWYVAGAFWHLRYFYALYNLCKLKCQGVINYVAVHSLHFIYKKGLKTGSKKAQTWEIT